MINVNEVFKSVTLDSIIDGVIVELFFLAQKYPAVKYVVYGSATRGGEAPKDIDIIVVGHNGKTTDSVEKGQLYKLDLTFCTEEEFAEMEKNLEAKFLNAYTMKDGMLDVSAAYSLNLFTRDPVLTRHAIARAASQAFVKGSKKLYESYQLGVKNLVHSIRIPADAVFLAYSKKLIDLQGNGGDTMELIHEMVAYLNLVEDMVKTVKLAAENPDDRDTIIRTAKMCHNRAMTQFRKNFPRK